MKRVLFEFNIDRDPLSDAIYELSRYDFKYMEKLVALIINIQLNVLSYLQDRYRGYIEDTEENYDEFCDTAQETFSEIWSYGEFNSLIDTDEKLNHFKHYYQTQTSFSGFIHELIDDRGCDIEDYTHLEILEDTYYELVGYNLTNLYYFYIQFCQSITHVDGIQNTYFEIFPEWISKHDNFYHVSTMLVIEE